jgi:hypothetical protein
MWPILTVAYIESVMSPALYASYLQWRTDNPGKSGRLYALILQIATEFRSALRANGIPVPVSDETAVPSACLRHAQTIILYELKREIGLPFTEGENNMVLRSDMFLRNVWTGNIPLSRDTGGLSPSYTAQAEPIEKP